jgi:hypothetical protein
MALPTLTALVVALAVVKPPESDEPTGVWKWFFLVLVASATSGIGLIAGMIYSVNRWGE